MSVLVVGASGATGQQLLAQLLEQGETVKAVVRSQSSLPQHLAEHTALNVTEASILDMTDSEMVELVRGCHTVASCLGHNLTFKGMFGHPRRLVTESVKRLCSAIKQTNTPASAKFVLMNTTGNQNKAAGEKIPFSQHVVVTLLRWLLPPHADNEDAAAYLQNHEGNGKSNIEWVAVRPDSLMNEELVTPWEVYESPVRNPIFDAGKTSRINVAAFMTKLIRDNNAWQKWQGKMPVIYNS